MKLIKEKRERYQAQQLTDLLLEAIRIKPLYRNELSEMFNLDKNDLNNFLCRLKKNNLIEIYPPDKSNSTNNRRWYKTDRTESYQECVKVSQARSQNAFLNSYKGEVKFSPHANPDMCITSNSYPTTGNKHRLSAWSGYSANGGM